MGTYQLLLQWFIVSGRAINMIRVQSLIRFPFWKRRIISCEVSHELLQMGCEGPSGLSWRNHFIVVREALSIACPCSLDICYPHSSLYLLFFFPFSKGRNHLTEILSNLVAFSLNTISLPPALPLTYIPTAKISICVGRVVVEEAGFTLSISS